MVLFCISEYLAFDLNNFLCLCAFLAHLQKRKNKDFGCAIVQNQYVFKGYCEKLELRNRTVKNLLSALHCFVSAVLKNSHKTQFPLANIARTCKN